MLSCGENAVEGIEKSYILVLCYFYVKQKKSPN